MSAPTDVLQRTSHVYVPPGASGVPLAVVHGARTDPGACIAAFHDLADDHGRPLLVPVFDEREHRGYQQLRSGGRSLGAAEVLHAAVDDLAAQLGRRIDQIDLVGFSAGAQFAHRYAMLFPARVRRLVVGAAGWYTYLDHARPFPVGIGPSEASGGSEVAVERFLRLPILVLVGERDVQRDPQLRIGRSVDRLQGEHRVARAFHWTEHLAAEASARGLMPPARLELLPRTGHSLGQALTAGDFGRRVIGFLAADPPGSGNGTRR
jgi:pimeloyl-ACP methyl ester carboxylesterase